MSERPPHPSDGLLLVVEGEFINHASREGRPEVNGVAVLEQDGQQFFLVVPVKGDDVALGTELLFDKQLASFVDDIDVLLRLSLIHI